MIINKKGISAVVANVLIVLLVVASVAIIWAVVRPTIEQAGEGIEAGCFTVQVKTESCSEGTADNVVVYRRAGAGTIDELKIIVESDDGGTTITDIPNPAIEELETKKFDATIDAYAKVDVAVVVSGNICEPTGVPVTCSNM